MNQKSFRTLTGSFTFLMVAFIVTVILCIVTHTTLNALITNILSDEILFAIRLSLVTATVSTVACMVVAIPVGYALSRMNFKLKTLADTIINLPLALPPLVAGVGLLLFFGQTPVGKALETIGLKFVFTPLGIIVAQFLINVPFAIRIMKSTYNSINPRYEHVAKTLGCTKSKAFWKVTLPMSKNGILASSAISWAKGIGEFGAVLMLAGATRMKTETLPIAVYLNMSSGNLRLAIAAATILIIVAFLALYVLERYGGEAKIY
ncbi:MAG: ABC-type sulfate transport system, permease component [Candidatus Methanohalarchaeum thermophilum]|uniref:ABC-type sulfate transport system, permease component n=1 Tax=Methanohalarchaeum thermophilum TaxID=1903181 RepID=A0A1Q6DX31_METT1|nr:MAG: ABC-type sulfate transport system, permease component [Candidatus Methanohalarchaeum thermophilum]